jgi:glycosyltransferase involved in cell wall biosynthesis
MIDRKNTFPGRIGIQQRVLPAYRAGFFELLAQACEGGLSIFSGNVHPDESIQTIDRLNHAKYVSSRNYHFLDVQSPFYLLWQSGLVDWLEDWNPDVLVVEANSRYLSTRKALQWMHDRGKPLIGWGLGAPPMEGSSSWWGKLAADWRRNSRRKFLNQLDAVIAYSHQGAAEYKKEISSNPQTFVAPNAVALRPVGLSPLRSNSFDQQPGVLFVGRIQARKRLENLIRACAGLPEALKPQLWIVGQGPVRDELKDLASQVYPSAEFPGEKRGPELESYFNRADLFVLPGTGGLAVQEAMAHGLPVIVAEGDGTQNDLVRSRNGWLIPADDEKALFETLKDALTDPARLRKMGAASFEIVQKEINVEHMVSIFVEAANSVMTQRIPHP